MRRLIPLPLLLLFLWSSTTQITFSQTNTDENCLDCASKDKALFAMTIVSPPESPEPDDEEEQGDIFQNANIRVINLGPIVNHEGVDYAPTISADGKTLYFVSDRDGSQLTPGGLNSHDFYKATKAHRKDTVFSAPVNLDTSTALGIKGVNTYANEGAASIAADKQSLFFTACERPDGLGSCDIYFVEIEGDKWGVPINLGKNVNSKYWESQPSIMYNKSRIYFSSDRPNKYGDDNTDIWYCDWDWDMEEWLPAKNLETINTEDDEEAPFIGTDGVSLFFSSDGYPDTKGGKDFYLTHLNPDDDTWSRPRNLGVPFNTDGDDYFITLPASGDIIYFSSTRDDLPGAQGSLDVFMAFVPTFYRTTTLRVFVQDECSGESIPADIKVVNRITNQEAKGRVTIENGIYEQIVANQDFGPIKDSNDVVNFIITASNPKYGSGEAIATIKKPSKTENQAKQGESVWIDTVIVTLGQKPVLGAIIDEADYVRRMKASKPELANYNGLVMEEVQTWDLYPLLSYVFFDEGSSELPDRYITFKSNEATANFTDTTIVGGTLDKYYHILNIYGYRLQKNPNSKITLVGCNDGTTPKEKRNRGLSKERVMLVYNYFKDVWNIDKKRMKVEVRNLPKEKSNTSDSLGLQENRRVELICHDWEVYKPVFEKDPKTFPQPEEMIFTLKNGIEDQLVVEREVQITRDGKEWKTLKDVGITDPRYTWDWLNSDYDYPKDEVAFSAKLVVTTSSGHKCESDPITIPVMQVSTEQKSVQKGSDSTLENYSLILFKFNSFDPGKKNVRIMNDYVYNRCQPTSRIEIIGHTDIVGLDEHNLKLSQNRAGTVHKGIEKKTKGAYGILNVKGVGEEEPLYDNNIPEGRFYNRTVNVIIRTPIEK